MKYTWTILGRSGSGKDTLVDILLLRNPEWKKVISKTTRPRRSPDETCHIFTNEEEYENDLKMGIIIAHNFYNGYHYWATTSQVDNSDFYIIDIPGLKELKNNYKGPKEIKAIGLYVCPAVAAKRMHDRGDDAESINKRLFVDNEAFKKLNDVVDVMFNCENMTPYDIADFAEKIIKT